MYQKIVVVGRVTNEVDMKFTPQGIAVANFNVVYNKRRGKGENATEEATFFKCTVWRERAETASNYISKGMRILVEGEVKANAWIDKKSGQPMAGLEITVSDFKFLDSKQESEQRQQATTNTNVRSRRQAEPEAQELNFDID